MGMPEREQIAGKQTREELNENESQAATPDADLGRAYAEAAEEMRADPLFDASPEDGLLPSTEEDW